MAKKSRSWPRVLGLLLVALFASVAQPTVLIAVPYVSLTLVLGVRRPRVFAVALVALALAFVSIPQGGGWYLERAWALLLGGCFAALTLWRPQSPFSERALGAVAGTAGLAAVMLGVRSGAWGAVQWVVQDRMTQGVATALDALRVMRGGQGLPQALVTTIYEAVGRQLLVFPAMLGLASFAALGVAWWVYVRLATDSEGALRPLRSFRFNDHLVWVLIGGVLLLVMRWQSFTLLGANAVVFMGALYAVRGAAVILFVSGGLSLLGYVLLVIGVLLVPPLVLSGAVLVGIGDTWLDVRRRVSEARTRHNDTNDT
jgi:hypothetical protein